MKGKRVKNHLTKAVIWIVYHTEKHCALPSTSSCTDSSRKESKWIGRNGTPNVLRSRYTWIDDYLSKYAIYHESLFHRRFRVLILLFLKICDSLVEWKPNCSVIWSVGVYYRKGIDSRIKVFEWIHVLRGGCSYDHYNVGAGDGEETVQKYLWSLNRNLPTLLSLFYFYQPQKSSELVQIDGKCRNVWFPGCAGAMHYLKTYWKNCSISMKKHYHIGKEGKLTTIPAEAWCDRDLYIWNWLVGCAGAKNEINVCTNSRDSSDEIVLTGLLGTDYTSWWTESFQSGWSLQIPITNQATNGRRWIKSVKREFGRTSKDALRCSNQDLRSIDAKPMNGKWTIQY